MNENEYNQKQKKNAIYQSVVVSRLFDEATNLICRYSELYGNKDEFYFKNTFALNDKVDNVIKSLSDKVVEVIETGEREAWVLSTTKNILLVSSIMRTIGFVESVVEEWEKLSFDGLDKLRTIKNIDSIELDKVSLTKFYGMPINLLSQDNTINLNGLKKQLKRRINNRSLYARVWNITDQLKEELELALDIGLGEGKSAAALSRDVRKFLKEPDKLFRRVRDKYGVLRLSKAAKAYHPGQGVYRSSYKNAMRLASTEINIAHRIADYERWKQLNFVIGIEIRTSNNHPVYDICDELKGEYPKQFKWVGWHPQCHCFAVPVLPTMEQFLEYQNKMLAGDDVLGFKFDGEIKDVPDNFKGWMKENKDRVKRAKSLPYFISDNKEMIEL